MKMLIIDGFKIPREKAMNILKNIARRNDIKVEGYHVDSDRIYFLVNMDKDTHNYYINPAFAEFFDAACRYNETTLRFFVRKDNILKILKMYPNWIDTCYTKDSYHEAN